MRCIRFDCPACDYLLLSSTRSQCTFSIPASSLFLNSSSCSGTMAHYKGAASESGRAMKLQKQREREKEELELRKKKIEDELKLSNIGNKFKTHYDAIEAQLKSSTIGLVTLDEMKAKQEDFVKERERQLAQRTEQQRMREAEEKRREKEEQKRKIQNLSFKFDDDEEEEEEEEKVEVKKEIKQEPRDDDVAQRPEPLEITATIKREFDSDSNSMDASNSDSQSSNPVPKKKKMMKNPDVDTSFLPDRDREEEERKLREQLRQEWVEKQEKLKNEEIEVTFSYWDGSGHRRSVTMKKGNTIYQFLQKALELVRQEFHDLRAITADTVSDSLSQFKLQLTDCVLIHSS